MIRVCYTTIMWTRLCDLCTPTPLVLFVMPWTLIWTIFISRWTGASARSYSRSGNEIVGQLFLHLLFAFGLFLYYLLVIIILLLTIVSPRRTSIIFSSLLLVNPALIHWNALQVNGRPVEFSQPAFIGVQCTVVSSRYLQIDNNRTFRNRARKLQVKWTGFKEIVDKPLWTHWIRQTNQHG